MGDRLSIDNNILHYPVIYDYQIVVSNSCNSTDSLTLENKGVLIRFLIIYRFIPESPRWLLKQKRISEAEGVIRYIAGINGKLVHNLDILQKIATEEGGDASDARFSYLDLFRRKELKRKTLVFIGIWFCWALQYFGISFNVKNFGVDPYLMLMLLGSADSIGFRAALLVNDR